VKKIISLLLVVLLITGCNKESVTKSSQIPSKINSTDNDPITSPINTLNLDEYMFREDVQYVDLRSSRMVLEEGYVAGFEFIPFYNVVASFSEKSALYQMKRTTDNEGNVYFAGEIGGFVAQFEESQTVIETLFDKNKYIFFISQGGTECGYMINLLIQLGYNSKLLYNVGGVSNSEGVASYRSIETNKYYVSGIGDFGVDVSYDYFENLTPIN